MLDGFGFIALGLKVNCLRASIQGLGLRLQRVCIPSPLNP